MTLTFKEVQAATVLRCERHYFPLHHWSPMQWGCALGGEAGEALNILKKMERDNLASDPVALKALGDELGDIVIYAVSTAARMGLDLGECVSRKWNEDAAKIGSPERLGRPSREA